MLQGRRLNLRNQKTKRWLFRHGAIEKLPKQRQCCTSNTAELHFPLSELLPPFSHICLCIWACLSICSLVRFRFFPLFCRWSICKKNKLALTKLPSTILLWLFDRSAQNSISHKTYIPLTFSTGETHQMEFYITKLDKGYSVVLSYDWLVCHNSSINWAETKVVFPGSVKASGEPPAPVKPEFNIQFVSTKNISCLCHEWDTDRLPQILWSILRC